MRVHVSITGWPFAAPEPVVVWPDDWPAPAEGAEVALPGGWTLFVRHVVWSATTRPAVTGTPTSTSSSAPGDTSE